MPRLKNTLIILSLILSFALFNFLNRSILKPEFNITKQESAFLLKQDTYLGLIPFPKRLLSSFVWISTMLESDLQKHYRQDENSWLYYRFMTISKLDPFFYENYFIGGKYLSIIKDDILGAEDIYKKGIRIYKHDFWLLINSAFNNYFELGNLKKATELYEKASRYPEAQKYFPILPSLLAKLKRELGLNLKDIYLLVYRAWEKEEIDELKARYQESLYSLKTEIDLICLNLQKNNCDKYDFYGEAYINENGKFKAKRKWKKFEISRRAKNKGGK
ncbi:MAG: hypothetical protein OEY33_07050 [Bdellovibrionales bacterium]|jgi:tetratricopeptide (TPR) repeat protein|nr:hypothetical protein [Bdellovibrionales bacterium]